MQPVDIFIAYSHHQVEEVAWRVGNNDSKTHSTSLLKANAFGLHDMTGNVWEGRQDRHATDYYPNSLDANPSGPTSGSNRVQRGGSWYDVPLYARVTYRHYDTPDVRGSYTGFRLARTL